MSFRNLQVKLGIFALGLAAIIVIISIVGANEHVSAATPEIDCSKAMPGQEQACISQKNSETKVTAWALPTAASSNVVSSKELATAEVNKVSASERDLSAGDLSPEALILFVVALAGIAFLGRRRKLQTHRK